MSGARWTRTALLTPSSTLNASGTAELAAFRRAAADCAARAPSARRTAWALVADPQLTDAYSYGHGGPLLALEELFSDRYMRRAFSSLRAELRPDRVLFAGDLFEGGREWAARERKAYDADLVRFRNVFAGAPTPLYVAGNHDSELRRRTRRTFGRRLAPPILE